MLPSLRLLLVEDDAADAELLLRHLRRHYDVTCERVDTAQTMAKALDTQALDIVISDYVMPHFSGLAALEILKEKNIDVPFIIVSGTIGEDTAVAAMRAGAQDFMPKGSLARLIPALQRELTEAAGRRDRKSMQAQLLVSDHMASMGILVAGVAHEINNPLAALLTNLDFAAARLRQMHGRSQLTVEGAEVDAALSDACEAAERMRIIVRDLKAFAHPNDDVRSVVNVHEALESSLRMAWSEVRHRARVVKDYTTQALVEGNEGRLGQLFLNLIVNAAQAMPEGQIANNELRITTRAEGDAYVAVEITDTGAGMAPPVVQHLFEPFFTTKPRGVGTGLGLAICKRIVTALGGEISVQSAVGVGTTFRVVLPAGNALSKSARSHAPSPADVHSRARILFVDDEAPLGQAVRRMLRNEHEVVPVTSVQAAVALIREGQRFDVILSDVMMPEATGMDLYVALTELAPDQARRMIFMTGGVFSSATRTFLDNVAQPCIDKPFDFEVLRQLIRTRR